MSAVSSAVGAACLNTAGLEYVGKHPNVLTNLVNASISLNESGQEHIQHMGSALDELSRHHPTLRPTILEAVNKQLQESVDAGKAFVPPEEDAVSYSYENVENPKTVNNKPMTDLAKVIKVSLVFELSKANSSYWTVFSATHRFAKILSRAVSTLSYRSRTYLASRSHTLEPTCIQRRPHCSG